MRIEFPHSARDDFSWRQPLLRVGSAPDNDLVLAAHQAEAHHLHLVQDRRGLVLEILPGAGRIYVNARPVRQRAILRVGDVLSMGDCRMLLRSDDDPASRIVSAVASEQCTAALRGVGGPLSGRVIPLHRRLEFGPYGMFPLDLPQGESASFNVSWKQAKLYLEAGEQSARYPLRLNGVVVQRAPLLPGDQVSVAMHRFVLDAPGMQPEPEIVLPPPPAPPKLPEDAAGPRGEVWWLIITAALLALGIALVLFLHF